jgi:hypothetical protein
MEKPNPKCKVCSCYWKPEGKDIKPSGLVAKSCPRCRKYQQDKRDYSRGEIYTITSPSSNDVYVGSTITSLRDRMEGHISDWKRGIVLGKHKDIVKDINDWNIRSYERYPCNNLEELLDREGEVIKEIGTLNIKISGKNNRVCNKEKTKNKKVYREEQKDNLEIYIENQKEDLKKYIKNQKDDLEKYIEEKKEDFDKYMEEQKDDFKDIRIKNAYNYSLEQKLIDEEYEKKLLRIEDEYDNDNKQFMEKKEEKYYKNDDFYEYEIIYRKKRRELLQKQKIDKLNDYIEYRTIKGVIYTYRELRKICVFNNIKLTMGNKKKYIVGSTLSILAFKLSKIETIIIPDDIIQNHLKD